MAENPVMKGDDSFDLSDSDDGGASTIEEFRHMIRRPDWYEVFKKQCEEQEVPELNEQRSTVEPEVMCVSPPTTQKKQKQKAVKSTVEPEVVCLSQPTVQKKKTVKKSSKSKRTRAPPKTSRTTEHQGTVFQTDGVRTRSSRRCVQTNPSQNVDPEIVFLYDDEEDDSIMPGTTVNAKGVTSLDDSIEIISHQRKAVNGEEIDYENRKVNVIFQWRSKVLTLPMEQDTQFGSVLPALLNNWENPGATVMLLYHNKIIKAADTPSDHEMFSGAIVECSIVKSKTSVDARDPNMITIKLQMKNERDKKQMAVSQMSQFQSIIERFAKEEGVPVDKVTFKFDGDIISYTDTPFSLGIENDFSIDVTY